MNNSDTLQNVLALLGRLCFSPMFIMAGASKIGNFAGTAAYMTHMGVPYAEVALVLAIIFELAAGLMILLGWKTRFAGLLALVFIVTVLFFFHNFWAVEPTQMENQMQHFMKNFTIMGGALYIMAFGAGKYSIDRK